MKKKRLLLLGILAVLVLAALIYTRPMPLEALCEADITQCQSVFGYHFRAPQVEDTYFELSADDERFSQLVGLFARQKFRRSLLSFLPQGGTVRQTQDGDIRWEVCFNFGLTDFPDGSTGSGTFLQCRNFFGVLRIFNAVEDETLRCTTSEQEAFLQQVYDIISAEP